MQSACISVKTITRSGTSAPKVAYCVSSHCT